MPDRLLITGSQTWNDRARAENVLAGVWHEWGRPADAVLVSGRCRNGADAICEAIWSGRGFLVEPHAARWHEHGPDCPAWHEGMPVCKKAGFRRDGEMVDLGARLCVALIDVCSRANCRRKTVHGSHGASGTALLAMAAGIETRVYKSGW